MKRLMLAAALVASAECFAQAYPAKPVTMIFPWPPGGADAMPRAVADQMSATLGQPVVFENRPGAGGTVGLAAVARAAPDGYTLAITDITSHAISGALFRKLSYDVVKDFAPVSMAGRTPMALVAVPALNVRTYQELVALARNQPGKVNFASSGNGAITHLAVERFKRMAKVDVVHIPYNGSGPAVASLLSGATSAAFATVPSVLANAKAGKLVLLGVTFTKPVPQLPDVPPVAQFLPGFDMGLYQGVMAPSATPRAVVERVHAAVSRAIADEKVLEVMRRSIFEPVAMGPEPFRQFLESEAKSWAELVHSVDLKID
jgi:tripartite-type tricarboxylate transporter receptor subunit TctC